jgi:hypothetical protein
MPELGIHFRTEALAVEVQTIRVVFHPADRTCDEIKMRPTVAGVLETSIDLASGATTATVKLDLIPADRYTVAAVGNSGDTPVAFGCAENQVISDGKRLSVELTLDAL